MLLSEWMTHPVHTVASSATSAMSARLSEAAQNMSTERVGALAVIDDGKLVRPPCRADILEACVVVAEQSSVD